MSELSSVLPTHQWVPRLRTASNAQLDWSFCLALGVLRLKAHAARPHAVLRSSPTSRGKVLNKSSRLLSYTGDRLGAMMPRHFGTAVRRTTSCV